MCQVEQARVKPPVEVNGIPAPGDGGFLHRHGARVPFAGADNLRLATATSPRSAGHHRGLGGARPAVADRCPRRAPRTFRQRADAQSDRSAPGTLLIADDTYWLLLPHTERPVELALRHVVAGELSHAGFLRVNLRVRYEPRHDGEETVGGVPCWRLELEPKSESAPFGRVRYWVAQRGFLPIRIEYYSEAGKLLKTARFTSYQNTGVGPRPARRGSRSTTPGAQARQRPRETTMLTLGTPRGVKTSNLEFDLDDLAALRDAARSLALESEAPVSGKQLVEALAAYARARGAARY